MKNNKSKKQDIFLLLPGLLGIVGLIIGSFFDLQISSKIANLYSPLSKTSESFGAIFGYGLGPLAATLLFIPSLKISNKVIRGLGWLILVIGIVLTAYIFGKEMSGGNHSQFNLKIPTFLCFLITFVYCSLASLLTIKIFLTKDMKKVFQAGLIIAIVLVGELLVQNVIKFLAGRPRFRYIESVNDYSLFKSWWQFDFLRQGIPDDYVKSLPSGHSMTTFATISILSVLPCFGKKLDCKTSLILYIVFFLYGLLVSISRVLSGAHFLSDISLGMILISLILFFTFKYVYKES